MYRRFLSVRYLRTRFVNLISVAAVMFGVAVLIVVTSVMDGFQAKVREVVRGTLSHVILTPTWEGPEDKPLPSFASMEAKLKSDDRVRAAAPQVTAFIGYPYKGGGARRGVPSFQLMEAVGIDWDKEAQVSEIRRYLKSANDMARPFWSPKAVQREKVGVIVSRAFIDQFFGEGVKNEQVLETDFQFVVPRQVTDENGDESYKFDTRRIFISGVYDADDQTADLGRVFLEREALREMAHIEPEYMEIRVALKDYSQADAVVASIRGSIPGFNAMTWEQMRERFLRAVRNEKVLLMIVLSFIVLLAGFTILATLTLTVVEKTRDIGILKALGGTTTGILSIFLRSGFLIGLVGAVLGLGLGIFVTDHVNGIKDGLEKIGIQIFPPDIYLFREIPTVKEAVSISGIVIGSVLLAFLAGLPPALRAARMDPVEALRYE